MQNTTLNAGICCCWLATACQPAAVVTHSSLQHVLRVAASPTWAASATCQSCQAVQGHLAEATVAMRTRSPVKFTVFFKHQVLQLLQLYAVEMRCRAHRPEEPYL